MHCFDKSRGLYADDIAHTSYSQHASIMGILSGSLSPLEELSTLKSIVG